VRPHPLSPPADSALLAAFSRHFALTPTYRSVDALSELAGRFATLPYENLSKVIRFADAGNSDAARELPADILESHFQWGTGGTCFSLTATLLHLVRSLGFEAEPVLADRPYGSNTHCALLVYIDENPHLLDPGFLIVRPVRLPKERTVIETPFNSVALTPSHGGEKLELATLEASGWKKRLTLKTAPVDAGSFLKAWDASYSWDMMHYPVLTRVVGQEQVYCRGLFHQRRSGLIVERQEIAPERFIDQIAGEFGIAREVISRAVKLFDQLRHPPKAS
jgi:arylamine N-acetyltransferase